MKKLVLLFLTFGFQITIWIQENCFGIKAGPNSTYFPNVNSKANIGCFVKIIC